MTCSTLMHLFFGGRYWQHAIAIGLMIFGGVGAAPAAWADDEAEEPLVTRVYNVADLTTQAPDYEFLGTQAPTLNLGASRSSGSSLMGGTSGGMGGMGGGMGGMGGGMGGVGGGSGGGFFRVPDQAQVLMQGPAGGAGGAGGAMNSPRRGVTVGALIDAITTSIDGDTWEETGGEGTIVALGGTLVITQKASTHKKVDELLKAIRSNSQNLRNVTVRATWLMLDARQLATLDGDSTNETPSLDRPTLARMAAEAPGYRGQITCFDGQTVYLVAGQARSKIIGAIPVVGGPGAGYQPITAVPQAGAVLQITPRLSADGKSAVIDVRNSVVEEDEAEPPAAFLAAPSGGVNQAKQQEAQTAPSGTLNIDRVNLLVQQFMTTVRVPTGKPVLLGGVTRDPTSSDKKAADAPQLYLFIETTGSEVAE